MLRTRRLRLRQWVESDFLAFTEVCANKEVMEFSPSVLSQEESTVLAKRIQGIIDQNGWGFWAVEIPSKSAFIGFVGLHRNDKMPFSPCVEIGWRLARQYWGQGYATEAAQASLAYAFDELSLDEVVSFTTVANIRSQSVMKKLGMHRSGENFMHPDIDQSDPLCEHVLYRLSCKNWQDF